MFKIIDTTTSRLITECANMAAVRSYLRAHYHRFYVIVSPEGEQVNYFGRKTN